MIVLVVIDDVHVDVAAAAAALAKTNILRKHFINERPYGADK